MRWIYKLNFKEFQMDNNGRWKLREYYIFGYFETKYGESW